MVNCKNKLNIPLYIVQLYSVCCKCVFIQFAYPHIYTFKIKPGGKLWGITTVELYINPLALKWLKYIQNAVQYGTVNFSPKEVSWTKFNHHNVIL